MTLLAGALLLGVLIFFHELGHFVVAKACGVRVLTFSLGFGPRVVGFKIGETDYRLSLLPLGGYVRMFGEDIHAEIPEEEKPYSFLHKALPQKAAIAAAGPIANFLLPVGIFFAFFMGPETVITPWVGTVLPGEAADQAGIQEGDVIVEVEGRPITRFSEFTEVVRARPGRKVGLVVERDGKRVPLEVVPRAVASPNPLEDEPIGQIGVMPLVPQGRVDVTPASPAAQAGLKPLDKVTHFAGHQLKDGNQLLALMAAHADEPWELEVLRKPPPPEEGAATGATEPVAVKVTVPAVEEERSVVAMQDELVRFAVTRDEIKGELERRIAKTRALLSEAQKRLTLQRGLNLVEGRVGKVIEGSSAASLGMKEGDQVLAVDGHALAFADDVRRRLAEDKDGPHVLGVRQGEVLKVLVFRQGPSPEPGLEDFKVFGALVASDYGGGKTFEVTVGPLEAMGRALKRTGSLIKTTLKSFWMLITLQVSFKALGGPITIFNLAGDAMDSGFERFVGLLCFISVNLGILNLLPVPVLDGGHLLLFFIEAVRRKELDVETKEKALKLGFMFLLVLMAAAIFNDLVRLVGG